MDKELVYSTDEETFYELDEVMATLEGDYEPGKHTISCGTKKKLFHKDFVYGPGIIESIKESCWGEHGDYAEDYLDCIKDDDIKELETMIADWLTKKAGDIRFFSVVDVHDVVVTTE